MFELGVDGLDGWVPVRVDLDEEALRADLADRLADQPEEAAGLVASVATRTTQASQTADEPPLVAMWARFEQTDQTVPSTFAMLRMVPVDRDATPASFAHLMTSDWTLHRPYELTDLETASGVAHQLTAVTTKDTPQGEEFSRHDVVFWIRPDDEEGMVLMASTLDLVHGAVMATELGQLAAGVRWG